MTTNKPRDYRALIAAQQWRLMIYAAAPVRGRPRARDKRMHPVSAAPASNVAAERCAGGHPQRRLEQRALASGHPFAVVL